MSLADVYWQRIHITLGTRIQPFTFATHVAIEQSWKTLAATCKLTLPRDTKVRGGVSLADVVRRGDAVRVRLGYNRELREEFVGYVAHAPKAHQEAFVVECEDEMWQLKQRTVSYARFSTRLPHLVASIAPGLPASVLDAEIGATRWKGVTPASILADIKEAAGIDSYFRNGVLHVGFRYPDAAPTVEYDFSRNIASHSLEFVSADDIRVRVKAISIGRNNHRTSAVWPPEGDDAGENFDTRTLHFVGLGAAELLARAKAEAARLRYDGLRGSFKAWGRPYVEHGWQARLKHQRYPEYNGTYLVDAVRTSAGINGFFRDIELGAKV